MTAFTDLERAALTVICDRQPAVRDQLRGLLATARLSERDKTGHGFYTSFDVAKTIAPIDLPARMVNGPNAEVAVGDQTLLMGFILWLDDGYPNCLEGFQFGTPSGGDIDLKSTDLHAITWLRTID